MFQTKFMGTFFVKLLSGECHRTSLMISLQWFRWWLDAVRQQAITWANDDSDLYHHMASLCHNELTIHMIVLYCALLRCCCIISCGFIMLYLPSLFMWASLALVIIWLPWSQGITLKIMGKMICIKPKQCTCRADKNLTIWKSWNGLVLSYNKPLPKPDRRDLRDLCCHKVSLGHYELRFSPGSFDKNLEIKLPHAIFPINSLNSLIESAQQGLAKNSG